MKFIATPIFDINGDCETPEYYTVLCQNKPKGKKMFCGENGNVIKLESMDQAKQKAKEIEDKYKANYAQPKESE